LTFTTYLSNQLHKKFQPLKNENKRISYGPCQFPAFWFCHQRAKEIEEFKKREYYKAAITIDLQDGNKVDITFERSNLDSLEEAEGIINKLLKEEKAKVLSIHSEEKVIKKPKPLNTIDLLVNASKRLNIDSKKATNLAQELYKRGYITYPRTESRAYSENLDIENMLKAYKKTGNYKSEGEALVDSYQYERDEREDIGDHPPIYPLAKPERLKTIKGKSPTFAIYDYIVRHFFATLSEDTVIDVVTTDFEVGEQRFTETH
jgi:DNA topoisomerase IA